MAKLKDGDCNLYVICMPFNFKMRLRISIQEVPSDEASSTWVSYLRINSPLRSYLPRPCFSKDLHYLSITLFIWFANLPTNWPTDAPNFWCHPLSFFDRPADRPTNRRSHLSPMSPFLRFPSAPCKNFTSCQLSDGPTDRRTDRRAIGRSVWRNQPFEGPLYEFDFLPDLRRTDRPTDRPLLCWSDRISRRNRFEPIGNTSGGRVRFWTCRGSKIGCKGAYLLR